MPTRSGATFHVPICPKRGHDFMNLSTYRRSLGNQLQQGAWQMGQVSSTQFLKGDRHGRKKQRPGWQERQFRQGWQRRENADDPGKGVCHSKQSHENGRNGQSRQFSSPCAIGRSPQRERWLRASSANSQALRARNPHSNRRPDCCAQKTNI